MNTVAIGNFVWNEDSPPILIAGPCVIEDADETLRLADAIRSLPIVERFHFIFKASYCKDNRSSADSYRGPGLDKGLAILDKIKNRLGCPVLSDVHGLDDIPSACEVLDVVQIPAFLSRQTSLLEAAAGNARAINVKKGQFLAPEDMSLVTGKINKAGGRNILLTERGTVFGYHDLVVDFRSFPKLQAIGYPVIFDITHSLQKPGGLGSSSGGEPEYAEILARAGAAVPCDGFFFETHFEPARALSDSTTMIPFASLEAMLHGVYRMHSLAKEIQRSKGIGLKRTMEGRHEGKVD
ncbi:MAG: 3-deoxy-8-phosphooctulonate synthase [Candidatus Latescibacterota bacterium]